MRCQIYLGGDFINKQEFITKTLTFIANSIFINIFAKIFGMSNSIVAVSIVVIALTLVAIDLRENIVKKTFYISMVMLGLGASTTLININPVLGLVINIPIIFLIIYEGTHNYKENMYFPFLLAYIFMGLSAPADMKALPMRMISIVVGCLYILIVQLVLNRDRFNKTVFHTKKHVISMVINKIDSILEGKKDSLDARNIYTLTKPIVKAIYDNRLSGKIISQKNKGILSIILCLENLYKEVCKLSNIDDTEVLERIKTILSLLDEYFYGVKDKTLVKEELALCLEELNKCKRYESLVDTIGDLSKAIELIEGENKNSKDIQVPIKNRLKVIDVNSSSFKFAIKFSLSISALIFLVDICNITYGRWIIFPMMAIIQPYFDGTVKKAIERVIGTVIGIILFVIIFTLVKDNMVRLNITIFLAYINLFVKKYHISTSLVAVSALGSVAMGGAGVEILGWRIFFTVVGCVIGLIINKFIYSCTLEEHIEELVYEYKFIIKELNVLEKTPTNEAKVYDNILRSKLIEYKLDQYNKGIIDMINAEERKNQELILKDKVNGDDVA